MCMVGTGRSCTYLVYDLLDLRREHRVGAQARKQVPGLFNGPAPSIELGGETCKVGRHTQGMVRPRLFR